MDSETKSRLKNRLAREPRIPSPLELEVKEAACKLIQDSSLALEDIGYYATQAARELSGPVEEGERQEVERLAQELLKQFKAQGMTHKLAMGELAYHARVGFGRSV